MVHILVVAKWATTSLAAPVISTYRKGLSTQPKGRDKGDLTIAIETGHRKIVSFPIARSFSIAMLVYQRGKR